VIDTPGMRELGLWDSREGVKAAFEEVEALFTQCRFSNCSHECEPGCAVLAALEDGSLPKEKWKRYKSQMRETAFIMNHSAYLKKKNEFFASLNRKNRKKKGEL
jgi:ribosome biogenesis GTPase